MYKSISKCEINYEKEKSIIRLLEAGWLKMKMGLILINKCHRSPKTGQVRAPENRPLKVGKIWHTPSRNDGGANWGTTLR
jgi:hypothetical protein